MKQYILSIAFLFIAISILHAQDEEEVREEPSRPHFESQLLIDNQTVIVPAKGTLEWDIQHRFGFINDGTDDLFGLYDPSNIRMAFSYSVLDKLNVGVGLTKFDRFVDFYAKYLILQQTRSGSMPVSVAYYGVAAVDGSDEAREYGSYLRQVSYFSQIIISRRFGPSLSLQVSPSHSHFNAVDRSGDDVEVYNMYGLSLGGRYKFSGQSAFIFDIQTPLSEHVGDVPSEPNISFGIEIATSSHAFQVFLGNYQFLVPQRNLAYNPNKFEAEGLLIGFNMIRLWNF